MRGFAWESRTKGTRIVDPDDLKRLFKSYLFGASNLNKFVLIDFDQALLDALAKESSCTVLDYRRAQR